MKRLYRGMAGLLIILLICAGCNNNNTEKEDKDKVKLQVEENVKTSMFGFETDKITILRWKDDALQDNELEVICDIEDKDSIGKIIKALKSEEWEEVSFEKQISAVPEYYISFNNGTLIKLLGDIPYGHIMNYSITNGLYDYFNSTIYFFPKELLNLIMEEANKELIKTTTVEAETSDPLIKDNIDELTNSILKDIIESYFLVFDFDRSFSDQDFVDYERAFQYMRSAGTYSVASSSVTGGWSVRPELYQYFDNDTEMITLATNIVDEYILSKFNTVVEDTQIKEYSKDGDTYTYYPFMGDFYYDILIDEVMVDGDIVRVTSTLTNNNEDSPTSEYHVTFIIEFVHGEYKFLSVEIKESKL